MALRCRAAGWPAAQRHGLRSCARGLATGDESITLGASDADVEHLIESNLDKTTFRRREDDSRSRVLTTRREALALYREIWRVTALFDWPDQHGRPWRDVLRESARQEFEAARYEQDPEILTRLLVVGRDAVHQVAERFLAKRQQMAGAAGAAALRPGGSGSGEPPPFGGPPRQPPP